MIHASMQGGQLLTRPLEFAGSRLALNFATSAAGTLRVELQDPDGKPHKNFTLADCPAHFGDTVQRVVTWEHGAGVGSLAGQLVRLRFELKDADLYTIRFVGS